MFPLRVILAASLLSAAAVSPALAQAASGEAMFKARCGACHSAKAGAPAGLGPNLSGVVGRKAAATSFGYSPALKSSKLVWTRDVLDKYLAGPGKLVPGTRMVIAVTDAAQRTALIAYLATAK